MLGGIGGKRRGRQRMRWLDGQEQRHTVRNGEEELSNLGQNEVMQDMRIYWAAHTDCPRPFPRSEGLGSGPGLEEWKILGLCFQG